MAISPAMNAQGMLELANGHFSPDGQYTSAPDPLKETNESSKIDANQARGSYLSFDAFATAWKTEFMMSNGWTLNEMSIF